MHVFDYMVDKISSLFRFHIEKVYAVILYLAGFRDISERYLLVCASRESVREWVHRTSRLFNPSRKPRGMGAVDETVVGLNGHKCFVWSAIDVDSGEIIAVYASRGGSLLNALNSMKRVIKSCENRPLTVVDRGPWHIVERMLNKVPWTLRRLGLEYIHETFGDRNRVERFFRELKDRTKRFHNNINTKSIEETAAAIALLHNIPLQTTQGGVIPS